MTTNDDLNPHPGVSTEKRKRMAIIASYFAGESYGLLGPQMAATIIQENSPYDCMVIAVTRDDNKDLIKKTLSDYFGKERPIIGFSTLSGREDLFSFAKELKEEGATTILAGPQADVDFRGETGWEEHPHRFKGLIENFSFALHGPAEQAIFLLAGLTNKTWENTPGLLYIDSFGTLIKNSKKDWEESFFRQVRWDNLFKTQKDGLYPIRVSSGQILQQIGCPYAAKETLIEIAYPTFLGGIKVGSTRIRSKGCSFCDVAVDKGFFRKLSLETVISQIRSLPEDESGRKIPFEMINENPLPELPHLLAELRNRDIRISQINLTMRADWFVSGEKHLKNILNLAQDLGVRILLSSVGFESFDDTILSNLNKGLTVEINLQAIKLMRSLKEKYPVVWRYSRADGAIHGFIHPTPWDTEESSANMRNIISRYALPVDILPDHSIPLIIHHASWLGDWCRQLETQANIRYKRYVSVIGWWDEGI